MKKEKKKKRGKQYLLLLTPLYTQKIPDLPQKDALPPLPSTYEKMKEV